MLHTFSLDSFTGAAVALANTRARALAADGFHRKSKSSRLRSRNRTIDEWLEGEDDDDAFVDLEDFIVDE